METSRLKKVEITGTEDCIYHTHLDYSSGGGWRSECPDCNEEHKIILINCTPHDINIKYHYWYDRELTIPPSGLIICLKEETSQPWFNLSVPFTRTKYGSTDLPEQEENTYFIVSQIVKNAFPERKDLVVPAGIIRDEKGNIIGCKSLGV